jgi:hypothetical protein
MCACALNLLVVYNTFNVPVDLLAIQIKGLRLRKASAWLSLRVKIIVINNFIVVVGRKVVPCRRLRRWMRGIDK